MPDVYTIADGVFNAFLCGACGKPKHAMYDIPGRGYPCMHVFLILIFGIHFESEPSSICMALFVYSVCYTNISHALNESSRHYANSDL